jgi:hypothetical protein
LWRVVAAILGLMLQQVDLSKSAVVKHVRVAEDSALIRHANAIYAPFESEDSYWLRVYASDVDQLVASSFFDEGKTLGLTFGADMECNTFTEALDYPGEEALRAVVLLFRPLYEHNESASFHRTSRRLREHIEAHESEWQAQALAELRQLSRDHKQALQPTVGIDWNGVELKPRTIIDHLHNAHYFHRDPKKRPQLDAIQLGGGLLKYEYLGAIQELTRIYWVGRLLVTAVLDVPSLLA